MNMIVSRLLSDGFLLWLNIAGVVTFLFPLFAFVYGRATSDEYNYENNQNQNNNNYNGNYNNDYQQWNNYNNPNCYNEYGNYVGPTHWWQFWKKCRNYGEGGEENERRAPWWYIWGEEYDRGPDEEEGRGAVLFLYVWTLVLFGSIVYFGNKTGMDANKLDNMRWMLIGFANYCLVVMVLLVSLEGGIETEAREMERTGFYGQTAVLLFLTSLLALITSIVFISWTTKRINALKSSTAEEVSSNGGYPAKSLTSSPDDYVAVDYEQQPRKSLTNGPQSPPGYKV